MQDPRHGLCDRTPNVEQNFPQQFEDGMKEDTIAGREEGKHLEVHCVGISGCTGKLDCLGKTRRI